MDVSNQLDIGGVKGALFGRAYFYADLQLAKDAADITGRYIMGEKDTITGKPISNAEFKWALGVSYLFGPIGVIKLSKFTY